MTKISVEAKSRQDLRQLAQQIREMLSIKQMYFPVLEILECLHYFDRDACFEIVEENELNPGEHAVTDIINKVIKIRSDVYEGACNGNGRDRMTIMHEFSHFITLCVLGFQLARNFDEKSLPAYCDPEWQAKCLAGELMMPASCIKDMSINEICECCGVSHEAAKFQLSKVNPSHDRE